jgi:hypothetical protein
MLLPSTRALACLEISLALLVPAVAINLRRIACPFTVGAAIPGTFFDLAIAGRILTLSSIFIVSHLSLPLLEFVISR